MVTLGCTLSTKYRGIPVVNPVLTTKLAYPEVEVNSQGYGYFVVTIWPKVRLTILFNLTQEL